MGFVAVQNMSNIKCKLLSKLYSEQIKTKTNIFHCILDVSILYIYHVVVKTIPKIMYLLYLL